MAIGPCLARCDKGTKMTVKQDISSTPAPLNEENKSSQDKERDSESALDEALEESFPASDPVAIATEKSPCPPT